eukprot:UN19994
MAPNYSQIDESSEANDDVRWLGYYSFSVENHLQTRVNSQKTGEEKK